MKLTYHFPMDIYLPQGLYAFENYHHFTLKLSDNQPFFLLTSKESPTVNFILLEPFSILDYNPSIAAEDRRILDKSDEQSYSLAVFVIVNTTNEDLTVNLRAPLIVNMENKIAKQVIVLNDQYQVRHVLNSNVSAKGRFVDAHSFEKIQSRNYYQ